MTPTAKLSQRKRRRRWKAPNNPTGPARQVWRAVYPAEPWPKGWRVEWAGFMRGANGLTIYRRKTVLLSHADCRRAREGGAVEVLLHELVHVRAGYGLRHGADFLRLLNASRARLGFEPTAAEREWK